MHIKHLIKNIIYSIVHIKKNAVNPTKTADRTGTSVNPITATIVPDKSVPIAPINNILPAQQMHLITLHSLEKLALNIVESKIPIAITDIIKAILIKFKVTGINPNENSIPTATPTIVLIITAKITFIPL